MLYCRKRNYNKTAFDIDQMADLSKFSRFLNIERFAKNASSPTPFLQTRADSQNCKRKLNSELLKIRPRKKSKETNNKIPASPDTNIPQNLRPEEQEDTFPTGKIQKIVRSKNCTIGKLIELSRADF